MTAKIVMGTSYKGGFVEDVHFTVKNTDIKTPKIRKKASRWTLIFILYFLLDKKKFSYP